MNCLPTATSTMPSRGRRVGPSTASVCPRPSCPRSFAPQTHRPPSVSNAAEMSRPAQTRATPSMMNTGSLSFSKRPVANWS